MSNYYEILQVETTASTEEISQAVDKHYNDTRKLVTHHDPNVVNQANQALLLLETIRTTLTDGDKRQVYDQAIGLSGVTGGLFDPTQMAAGPMPGLPMMAARPPASPPVQPPQVIVQQQSSGIWACPNCKTDNPPQAVHCFKCGSQLVRQCPECHKNTSLISTGICGHCGFAYDVAVERRKLERLLAERKLEASHIQRGVASVSGKGSANVLLLIFGILFILTGVSCIFTGLPGLVDAETIAMTIIFSIVGVVIAGLGIGGIALYIVLNRKSNSERSEQINTRVTELDQKVNEIRQLEQRYMMLAKSKTKL